MDMKGVEALHSRFYLGASIIKRVERPRGSCQGEQSVQGIPVQVASLLPMTLTQRTGPLDPLG